MKKILMALILMGFTIPALAEIETTDVRVDSYTFKAITISSSTWTPIITQAEVSVSTGGTRAKLAYTMSYFEARHLGTGDMAICSNNTQAVAEIIPLKGNTEIYLEKMYFLPMWARMKAGSASTTLFMQIGYRKRN